MEEQEEHEQEEVEEEEDAFICEKCDMEFKCVKSLKDHKRRLKGSCMGGWYVCRRCTKFFNTLGELNRHQAIAKICPLNVTTPTQPTIPKEIAAWVRYEKAISDAGGTDEYLKRAARRINPVEMNNVLEAASLTDIDKLFVIVNDLDDACKYHMLALLSDFANGNTTSLEKREQINQFVNKNIML